MKEGRSPPIETRPLPAAHEAFSRPVTSQVLINGHWIDCVEARFHNEFEEVEPRDGCRQYQMTGRHALVLTLVDFDPAAFPYEGFRKVES